MRTPLLCGQQIGARECVLPKDDTSPERRRLLDVLGRAGALATERKASEFSGKDVQHDLTRLLKGNVEHYRAVLEREGAAGCIAALLSFTELMADLSHHGKFTLVLHEYVPMHIDRGCIGLGPLESCAVLRLPCLDARHGLELDWRRQQSS